MTINANGRSALILATGLFVCFAGQAQAASGAEDPATVAKSETAGKPVALHKYARAGSRHVKRYAHRKSGKVAMKASPDSKKADTADDSDHSSAIPPSVANANAQLTPGDTPTSDAAKAMTARANGIVQAAPDKPADAQPTAGDQPAAQQPNGHVVAADQLNDVDRALRESPPPASSPSAATLALASAETPAAPVTAASNQSSTWDQTSLIGRIFIGFGALLTMASAARMFMA